LTDKVKNTILSAMDRKLTKNIIFASLFTALIIISTLLMKFTGGIVPVVSTTLFVILAGMFLKPIWAAASVLLYLAIGAMGFSVFSQGGGIGYFIGPLGGYLVGYLFAALTASWISHIKTEDFIARISIDAIAILSATFVIFIPGVLWLAFRTETSIADGIAKGFLPFILSDLFKAVLAFIIIFFARNVQTSLHAEGFETLK
jgi:biotin transport system substrate-specific component